MHRHKRALYKKAVVTHFGKPLNQKTKSRMAAKNNQVRTDEMAIQITFNGEACKGCGLCMLWCKRTLVAFDTSTLNKNGVHPAYVQHTDQCIACGNCALMCPDGVITIQKTEG